MSTQSQDWTTVTKKTKPRKERGSDTSTSPPRSGPNKGRRGRRFEPIPDFASSEEEAKFVALKAEIPHLMMPGHIRRIARKINIDALSDKVLSEEWIAHQRKGWEYVRVVKPDDVDSIPDDDTYDIVPLDNGWGDVVLFRRVGARRH